MDYRLSSVALLCFVIAACGGEGWNQEGEPDPQEPPPPPPPSSFAITAENAEAASAQSWKAANSSMGLAGMTDVSGMVTTKPGSPAKAATGVPSTTGLVSLLLKVPFGPETYPCQVAGSITLSGDLASPTALTAGDVINVEADGCDDGLGEILDGAMAMTVDAIDGDLLAGAYALTMTLEMTNMQVTTFTDTQTSNGDVTVTLDTLAAPLVYAGVGGSSLTIDSNTESLSLANYETAQSVDTGMAALPYTMTSSGVLDSSELPAELDYETPVTFEGEGTDYPHTGELLVTGDASSARLVAIDNVNVRIDVDVDGDGTVDESIETTWAALTN